MAAPGGDLRDTFHAAQRRLTAQRQLVLAVLEESDGHLDVEAIHDRVKAQDSKVSLATVYRTLAVLGELGLVEQDRLGEDHGHYEAVRSGRNYHFTCLRCGAVTESGTDSVVRIASEVAGRCGVQVTQARLHLGGYCAACRGSLGSPGADAVYGPA